MGISWRDIISVHPAAELFEQLPGLELSELAEDIKRRGIIVPLVTWTPPEGGEFLLLDGRNRLEACEQAGILEIDEQDRLFYRTSSGPHAFPFRRITQGDPRDPYAIVISLNIRRRHLDAARCRKLIADLLKAAPQKSNRQVAKTVGVSHPTVAKIREDLEEKGDVEKFTTSIDTKGRQQPAHKSPPLAAKPKPPPEPEPVAAPLQPEPEDCGAFFVRLVDEAIALAAAAAKLADANPLTREHAHAAQRAANSWGNVAHALKCRMPEARP